MKQFIEPADLVDSDLPLIVLSDQTSGFMEWAIKWRTRSNWNHIMFMLRPKKFVSQGNVFSEVGMERYMGKNYRLKLWRIMDLTCVQKKLLYAVIDEKLSRPWWERQYDYLGILGQAIGVHWIQNPFKRYCSEIVAEYLSKIMDGVPKRPSPEDLDKFFNDNPDKFELVGYWGGT